MGCLSENQIVAFFTPGRSAEIAALVDAHAAGCERCRTLLAEYAQLSEDDTSQHSPSSQLYVGSQSLTLRDGDPPPADERVELVQRLARAQAKKHIGAVLKDKWTIEELLGTGGMAHVFAARHRNGRRVAVKCMRPELILDPQLVKRFLREGYLANKIDHPAALSILDDDVMEDGTPFLVMELLTGKTLRRRLDGGPLPVDEAVPAVLQVLDLLAAAHDKGIVHRDLKPDNLFQTDDGSIKVLDFGIARLKETARPEFETRSGTTMGTVGFMPPEQARGLGAQVDARSDVWALGATLFALLAGRAVHQAATTNEALLLAMTTPVPPMRELLPWLAPSLQAFLDTALAFDKEKRYPSARAMKQALEEAMAAPSLPATASLDAVPATLVMSDTGHDVPADRDRRSPASWMAIVAAVLVTSSVVLVLALRSLNHAPPSAPSELSPSVALTPPAPLPVPSASAPAIAEAPTASAVPPPAAPHGGSRGKSNTTTATTATARAPGAAPARTGPPPPPAPSPAPPTPAPTPAAAPIDTRDPLGPRR